MGGTSASPADNKSSELKPEVESEAAAVVAPEPEPAAEVAQSSDDNAANLSPLAPEADECTTVSEQPPPAPPPPAAPVALPPLPSEHTLPPDYVDAWDRWHVRLPCSPQCVDQTGAPLWTILCRALHPPPETVLKLTGRLSRIRKALGGGWTFRAFHEFLNSDLDAGSRAAFFTTTLPHMCALALRLPALFKQPLPLLLKGRASTVELSHEQCACLMVHAFFCSMPFRSEGTGGGGHSGRRRHGLELPDFSFCRMHSEMSPARASGSYLSANQAEKWKCLMRYFATLAARSTPAPLVREPTPPPPPGAPSAAGGSAAATSAAAEPAPDASAVDLTQCTIHMLGFGQEEENDIANELRTHGACVLEELLDLAAITHLLVDETPAADADAAVEIASTLEQARAAGVQIVSSEWYEHAIAPAQAATAAAHATRTTASSDAYSHSVGGVRFERLVLDTSDMELDSAWTSSDLPLCAVDARADGTIEDFGAHVLHLDFANEFIGGGVLGHGCVQEEIRFVLSPELIVSRALCERMADNEALVFRGFERFSSYTGYAKSFADAGAYADDADPGRRPALLAIDAMRYRHGTNLHQYDRHQLERELNKALVGFFPARVTLPDVNGIMSDTTDTVNQMGLCTGNWGCGVFGGDLHLKAIIQLLAASQACRPCMHYLTFGDSTLARDFGAVVDRLRAANCNVGELVKVLTRFAPRKWPHRAPFLGQTGYYADLFSFIHAKLDKHEQRQAEKLAAAAGASAAGEDGSATAHEAPTPPTRPVGSNEARAGGDGDATEDDEDVAVTTRCVEDGPASEAAILGQDDATAMGLL